VIILDTNVLSEPLRPAPAASVVEWLDAQAPETLYLTTITLAEMRFGIAALPGGKRKTALAERLEDAVVPFFTDRILSFDEPSSREYADLRAQARAQGLSLGDFDSLIAGIARAHHFEVATRDTAPFEAAGVRAVINPFE